MLWLVLNYILLEMQYSFLKYFSKIIHFYYMLFINLMLFGNVHLVVVKYSEMKIETTIAAHFKCE